MSRPPLSLLVLAAGLGTRLRPLTDELPKCLVPLSPGRPLVAPSALRAVPAPETPLGRIVGQFAAHGVRRVVLVTGHAAARLEAWAREASRDLEVVCVFNPRYATWNNAESVRVAAGALRGHPFVQVDGDLVVDDAIVRRVVTAAGRDAAALAVDTAAVLDEEAMKVALSPPASRASAGGRTGRRVEALGKWLPLARADAEAIGIACFGTATGGAYFEALRMALLERGHTQAYYEDVLHAMVEQGTLALEAVDVAGLAWAEIDDPADLARARALVAAGEGVA